MNNMIAIFLTGLLFGSCIGWTGLYFYRKRMKHMLTELLQKLDNASSGITIETSYDETIDAAISERLNRLVHTAQLRQSQTEQERDSVKSLISDISHQVRTPLSNIMLYSQILQEALEQNDTFENVTLFAEKIQMNSEKLDFFMKELVKSSYMETEMLSLSPKRLHLSELLRLACQQIEVSALKREIEVNVEKFEGDDFCCADEKWTLEAIENVLENAVKYSPEHAAVFAEIIAYESFLCISIRDSGAGIAEEEQALIFQRFYRSQRTADSPGFGIGLYLAREVLSRQGGYIKVKSAPDKGAEFQLFFAKEICQNCHF